MSPAQQEAMKAGHGKIVECEFPGCGKSMAAGGMGNHMAAHRRAVERLAAPEGGENPPKPSKALRRASSPAPEPSAFDIAMAVLAKVSPDGRIAITDLPEVAGWIEHTHRVVALVGASTR
jgi:hypothetical protein